MCVSIWYVGKRKYCNRRYLFVKNYNYYFIYMERWNIVILKQSDSKIYYFFLKIENFYIYLFI